MRTVKVYHLTDREAFDAGLDNGWDYENQESQAGWYWDSWVDGREATVSDGPYSTRKIAEFAAGMR